ncbi:MAG TPA: hypothetical protein VMR52_12115 [Dehalococcoidia bacterium]|nr:hypothetical protein [Dehalococcoidia bacterium]
MAIEERSITHENLALLLDLVEWVARQPRTRAEVIETWGTHCPRFPVWEDAAELGLVARRVTAGSETVEATPAGRDFLREHAR